MGVVMQEQKVSRRVPVLEEPAALAAAAQGGHSPAIPTIDLLCQMCEKALPFLSHAAGEPWQLQAPSNTPAGLNRQSCPRNTQMCAGLLGIYWHIMREISIGPGWCCVVSLLFVI